MSKPWYEESLFYHIYPLGFCDAPEVNDFKSEPVERLLKICDWIPHMKSMGVDALYLGPLFESGSHGYDTVDYNNVDRRLGTNDTLKKVVKELHDNDIKVVLDGVFNHVSREFFAFKNLIQCGEGSKYRNWFKNVNFNSTSPKGDNFAYDCWSGHFELPALNLRDEFVESHILNAITMWVQEFDIDGLRLDVAEVLDFDFMKELSSFASTIKPDFWLLGEVIHGDYNNWVNNDMLHATTNYECYKGIYSSLNDSNFFEIAHSLNRLFNQNDGLYKGMNLYNFVDNHDVTRVASTLNYDAHLYPLYILLFTIPGVPSIYYGSEWGITGDKGDSNDKIVRPSLDLDEMNSTGNKSLVEAISRISELWHYNGALKHGSYKEVMKSSDLFAFEREYGWEKVTVAVNSQSHDQELTLNVDKSKKFFQDLLNGGKLYEAKDGVLKITVPPTWGSVISEA